MANYDGMEKKPLALSKGMKMSARFTTKSSIAQLLVEAAARKDRGVTFIENDESETFVSYEDLLVAAKKRLYGLKSKGVSQGDSVMLILEDNKEFLKTFWACILGGIVPAPLSYPQSFKTKSTAIEKIKSIWGVLGNPLIISDHRAVISPINELLGTEMTLIDSELLDQEEGNEEITEVEPTDPAFIQFSSGSTSIPKGVLLSHENLLSNIDSIVDAAQFTDMDRSLSWMPYHHDMGLIGFHISMMAMQIQQFNMSPTKFVKKPILWLELITKHKITLTGCPNFGYRLLLGRAKEEKLQKLDLRSLRLIFNGAEPIAVSVMNAFVERLEPYGLNKRAMFPVYGMAEACVAACFPPCESEPKIHTVNRHTLNLSQTVEETDSFNKDALLLADEGFPINGLDVRIVTESGEVASEKTIGEIQLSGPNMTKGYINNEEANQKAFQDGWFRTGDTGFIHEGRLTVIGRLKDIIFCNGQNYYAHDIEIKMEELEGVKTGKLAVCGWQDANEGTEKVAVFSTLRIKKQEEKTFYQKMLAFIRESTGLPIDYVVLVNTIPKTTSGKIQRFELIHSFQSGFYTEKTWSAEDLEGLSPTEENHKKNPIEINLLTAIKTSWADVLNRPLNQIPEDTSFLSLGGSSLKAIQVLGLLEEELEITLSHDLLIQCRTVSEMNHYLTKLLYQGMDKEEVAVTIDSEEELDNDEIAVISMACRFPDASSPEEFWDNLLAGKNSIDDIPLERFGKNAIFDNQDDAESSHYTPKGAFLNNPFDFDPSAFGITDEEALVMDPQQRLLLELVYEVFERANYSKEKVSGQKIGLYLGAGVNAYYEHHLNTINQKRFQSFESFNSLGADQQESLLNEWKSSFGEMEEHPNVLVDNILNMISARSSQVFNLKGPSMVIDTACSSSLVSLHMACKAIAKGEARMAIAGGINLLLTATPYRLFNQAGALSRQGESNVFDQHADGFVPGEGAGVVLLKPVRDAVNDGDQILAVIKSSAINNDGHSIGVMAPNPEGQRQVIQSAYENSNINPSSIQYMEAHGTGTRIGDPSEIRALDSAFQRYKMKSQSIALGSVKANVGHLLSSAGIASFIKVVMSLKNQMFAPQINVMEENPMLQLSKTPFYLNAEPKKWETSDGPRRAAINSFGFGGTNCHLVLEEGVNQSANTLKVDMNIPAHAVCLSGHSQEALIQKAKELAMSLDKKNYELVDVARTQNLKTNWDYRKSFSGNSMEDLKASLATFLVDPVINKKKHLNSVLLFTGQGSQYVGMGQLLYQHLPVFKKHFDECCKAFESHMEKSLIELLFDEKTTSAELAKTNITQPVVYAIDYSLGKLLMDMGIKPTALIGHSVGEWVAATLAGVVSLEDAARCVALRGKLMNELSSSGAMAAVFVSKEKLAELLIPYQNKVWIAGYNVTHQAISGSEDYLNEFLKELNGQKISYRKLNVSQAFHTPLMEPMLHVFKEELKQISFSKPDIPIISNITAQYIDEPMDASYWVAQITSAVKFDQSVEYAMEKGANFFIEAGPDHILAAMANSIESSSGKKPGVCSLMNKKKPEIDYFVQSLGVLFEKGISLDWSIFYNGLSFKNVDLPLYPFVHKSYSPNFGELNETEMRNWVYKWRWTADQGTETNRNELGATLLFVSDSNDQKCSSIHHYLVGNTNRNVYEIEIGKPFSQTGEFNFTINPEKLEDWRLLKDCLPTHVNEMIYLSNGNSVMNSDEVSDGWKNVLTLGSFASEFRAHQPRLVVVTNKAYSLDESDHLSNPNQIIEATFANVLDLETDISASVLDLNEGEWGPAIDRELKMLAPAEGVAIIREGKRFVRSLDKTLDLSSDDKIIIEENDTYLFTGGAGSIGSEIALALANKAPLNLVLIGATPLSKEANDRKRQLIAKLETLGSNVTYFSCDVSSRQDMQAMFSEVKELYGSINGVIHGAGILSAQTITPLIERDIDDVSSVLRPKVTGALILDELTRKEPLKFFVMLSSISATKKAWSAGLGDYAGANAFLDSYSYYRKADKKSPGKTVSINYSLWEKEGIARSVHSLSTLIKKTQGLEAIPSSTGTKLFFQALHDQEGPVIHILKEKTKARRQERVKHKEVKKDYQVKIPVETKRQFSKADIHELVYQITAAQVQLSVGELETNRNFEELGIDSIRAVTVLDQVAQKMQVELYPTLLFEYQTPYELAKHLEGIGLAVPLSEPPIESMGDGHKSNKPDADIAIIGIGLRFPGATTTDEYWDLLRSGKSVIQDAPIDRWSKEDHVSTDRNSLHSSYINQGGFIDRPYDFDPAFFGMSPSEAEATDPQQRLFLEVAWEALQQAGYGSSERTKSVGVYVGCEQNTYMEHFIGYRSFKILQQNLAKTPLFTSMDQENQRKLLDTISNVLAPGKLVPDAVAGNGLNEVAARVSHLFNLTGPSMVINTACSSSLVAVHQACEGLRSGQMEMALVGGVNLNLSPTPFASLSRVSALSPTGECRPFDKDADGMVLSEGCSAVLLKPVSEAKKDKDHIFAVIKGSAINNDGRSQGITAPRPQGQAAAVRAAYQSSGINPETVSYIEAHGTGTPLGDPIEIEGLNQAFKSFTQKTNYCGIGSVKSSIGHMLAASGLSSLIKVALSMEHQQLPKTVNYHKANVNIPFEKTPFYVVGDEAKPWQATGDTPLRAGVNAFGFGGTNAHIILEEAPLETKRSKEKSHNVAPQLVILNGRNKGTLKKIATNLKHYLNGNQFELDHACFSLNTGQKALTHKVAAVIHSNQHLIDTLLKIENGENSPDILEGKSNPNKKMAFNLVLTGKPHSEEALLKQIFERFPRLEDDFYYCMDAVSVKLDKPEYLKWSAISFEFALCNQVQRMGTEIETIYSSEEGLFTGLILKNKGAINQIFSLFCDRSHNLGPEVWLEDGNTSNWTSPLITPLGNLNSLAFSEVLEALEAPVSSEVRTNKNKWFSFTEEGGNIMPTSSSNDLSLDSFLRLIGSLVVKGANLTLSKISGEAVRHIPLPTYPFERSTYRIASAYLDDEQLLSSSSTFQAEEKNKETEPSLSLTELNQELQLLTGSLFNKE